MGKYRNRMFSLCAEVFAHVTLGPVLKIDMVLQNLETEYSTFQIQLLEAS